MPLDAVALWLDALERDPKQAVGDLLSGRIERGQFARLDCAEFLQRALADPRAGAAATDMLDEGLAAWLAEAMERDDELRKREGFHAHLYRLNEAFAAVALLEPPHTAYRLRELHPAYRRWLQRYDQGYGDGPYAGYWRALAASQKDDAPFRQQWFEFVVHAGERYPRYLLQMGLAGLRRLPGDPVARNLSMINALLRRAWRIGTDEALADFAERISALKAEFPMSPDTWRARVFRLLQLLQADEEARGQSLPPAKHGRKEARLADFTARLGKAIEPVIGKLGLGEATAQAVRVPEMPSRMEFDAVSSELRDRKPMAIKHALELFEGHRLYAEASCDSYFFVRTLCNLGHRLLKQPGLGTTTLESLRALLRHALAWESEDPHSWSFWAELEQAEGREDVAEVVLWETVRRFPQHELSRVELALLLQRRHAREADPALLAEAEQLLREAITASPRHKHSRVELSLLLQRRHANEADPALLAAAEQLLREVATAHPRNAPSHVELALLLQHRHAREADPTLLVEAEQLLRVAVNADKRELHARSELARLLARNGRADQAQALLSQWLAERENQVWQHLLQDITAGKTLPLPEPGLKQARHAVARPAAASWPSEELDALRANAAAVRFAYAHERGEGKVSLEPSALHYDLARFYSGWFGLGAGSNDSEGIREPYALAALNALASPGHWDELERYYPNQARDSVLLKLYAGVSISDEARAELKGWIEGESEDDVQADIEAQALESDEAEPDETTAAPTPSRGVSYDDFLRRRLRETAFLDACAQSPAGLARRQRDGVFDRLFERHLAHSIEADIPPVSV